MKVLIMKFTNKKDRVTEAVVAVVIAHVTFPRWPVMRHEVFYFYFFVVKMRPFVLKQIIGILLIFFLFCLQLLRCVCYLVYWKLTGG